MTESQNNNELKIIKARVEQDKYEAVELKIIKANGTTVLKDLYIEKELESGSLFVASDNVLVTLHRTLKAGMTPNFELITKNGEIMLQPLYKEIRPIDNNMLIAVKTVPEMISVKNNQTLRTDVNKVQEIAQDSKNIKEQMTSTMKQTNPTHQGDLEFLYEDSYEEASLYRIVKDGNRSILQSVAEKVSFIATDGNFMYTHSNIVPDVTKSEKIDTSIVLQPTNTNPVMQNNSDAVMPSVYGVNDAVTKANAVVNQASVIGSEVSTIPSPSTNINSSVSEVNSNINTPVNANLEAKINTESIDKDNISLNNIIQKNDIEQKKEEQVIEDKPEVIDEPIHSANIDKVILPDEKKEPVSNESNEIKNQNNYDNIVFQKNFFEEEEETGENKSIPNQIEDSDSHIFDEFFGINDDSLISDNNTTVFDTNDNEDRYEQLSNMISRVISKDKTEKARIRSYEEKIRELESRITKVSAEVESKTKKVNILINQNRQLGDDNRTLKNRVSGLESKTSRLEEENRKYLSENERLKSEARSRENKLSAMISSVSKLLGSYRDVDSSYTKRKVA